MKKRQVIAVSMVAGVLWALAIVWGSQAANLPFLMPQLALPAAFFGPGLVTIAMIGRLAQRRFFDYAIIDGQDFVQGSSGWIDQKVLSNTIEQLVLALVIWPFVASSLGGLIVLIMGFAFVIARLLFWIGYHISPPMRGFGFAATFYPTVLAAIWSVLAWVL
jgi:MAPEG family